MTDPANLTFPLSGVTYVEPTGNGGAKFSTYNLDINVGDTFQIMDYVVIDNGILTLGIDFQFIYTDTETWHLTDFNNNSPITIVANDLNGGNQGPGEYRIDLEMPIGSGQSEDHMTIRVSQSGSTTPPGGGYSGSAPVWQAIDFGSSSGILVVHNVATNALMKNLNGGTFNGVLIADDIVHIHCPITGMVFALTSTPSAGNCIGNGSGSVLYSQEAIAAATQIVGTPSVSIQSWVH